MKLTFKYWQFREGVCKIQVILEVTDVFYADTDTDCVILLIMTTDTDTAQSPGCL